MADILFLLSKTFRSGSTKLNNGWVEFEEMHHLPHRDDNTIPSDYPPLNHFRIVTEGLHNLGVNLDASLHEAANLSSYGFINVRHEIEMIHIGPWAEHKTWKTIGLCAKSGTTDGLQAMAFGPLCRVIGWSREEVEVMLIDVRKSLLDPNIHAYMPYHITYGQKPKDAKGPYVEP